MQENIASYRSPEEHAAWNQVRERIPRGRKTRGLHFEVLEYLFFHLGERVSEGQIRNHLLEVRGHLQPTGDPVKVAINLAIKELQRLPSHPFDLIKLQEPNPQGKQTRFVKLVFAPFHGVISENAFQAFMRSLLFEKRGLCIRMFCQTTTDHPFPGIPAEWLTNHQAILLTSDYTASGLGDDDILVVAVGSVSEDRMLIYPSERSPSPALGFLARQSSSEERSEAAYQFLRAIDDGPMLEHLHMRWQALAATALTADQSRELRDSAREISQQLARQNSILSESAVYQAMLIEATSAFKQRMEGTGS